MYQGSGKQGGARRDSGDVKSLRYQAKRLPAGTASGMAIMLITRRSQVQILPPPPNERPGDKRFPGLRRALALVGVTGWSAGGLAGMFAWSGPVATYRLAAARSANVVAAAVPMPGCAAVPMAGTVERVAGRGGRNDPDKVLRAAMSPSSTSVRRYVRRGRVGRWSAGPAARCRLRDRVGGASR